MTKSNDTIKFPITRFRGSKRKLLPWIESKLSKYDYTTVIDAFGGSASVSYLLKTLGKEVTFNDKLKFNHIIGKAVIENNRCKISIRELDHLLAEVGKDELSSRSTVSRNFEGLYYTEAENRFIDAYINVVETLSKKYGWCEYKLAVLYYALFQACLIKRPYNLFHRANLNMRTRCVSRSFGNKVTWERGFNTYIKRFVAECNNVVIDTGEVCKSINRDAFEIKEHYDLVYLDPPYIGKKFSESEDYLKCYHFLEGLANYDSWEQNIDHSSAILKFHDKSYYESIEKLDRRKLIDNLALTYKSSIIALSYKISSKDDLDEIKDVLCAHKKQIEVHTVDYSYALSGAKNIKECLIIAS